jgi:hypothetical protein
MTGRSYEALPFVDEHATTVPAPPEAVWPALPRPAVGFTVTAADEPRHLALEGRHPFSRYALVFRVDPVGDGGSRVRAQTWAAFPGPHGRAYRALVIGSRGHVLAVKGMLAGVARRVARPSPATSWGATADERALALPCDEVLPDATATCWRAVTIDAPAARVFPWLCQLRAAPYSYDLIDNFGQRSPRELDPALQDLAEGQRFMTIFRLVSFERDRHVTLRTLRSGPFGDVAVTYALLGDGADRCRLLAKIRATGPRALSPALPWLDLPMMRKQLLTLKELAED